MKQILWSAATLGLCLQLGTQRLTAQGGTVVGRLNLVAYGDSLTEGVPHLNGEVDTYPFKVTQQFAAGSTYTKLGYRGQTTDYLRDHLDAFLFTLYKTEYDENIVVLWAGANDCALGTDFDCVDHSVYANLVRMARACHTVGWKVVVVTMIARGSFFLDDAHQTQFPVNQSTLNDLLRKSAEFDAVADAASVLRDPSSVYYSGDHCHLSPMGYQVVADLVTQAILSLP